MTTKREFVNAEARALIAFEDRNVDPWHPENSGGATTREYRCGCGFKTSSAGDIYDHTLACAENS